MISTRNEHAAAEMAAQDEDQNSGPRTDFEAVPGDLAEAALKERQDAADAEEQAARCRSEAASVVAAAQAEAERVKAEGQAKALPLIADATALERKATTLSGRSKHLEHAARQKALTLEQEALVADLSAERERLAETIAGLDDKLAGLSADRERLEAEFAEARTAGDVSRLAALRTDLDATATAMEGLSTEQRAPAQARLREIGDGTETGPGLLTRALSAASGHRAALTKALDELYPDRAGAHVRRAWAEVQNALEGNLARIAEEANAKPGQPSVQHIGNTAMIQRR